MNRRLWVIAYDVADNRRRYRVEQALLDNAAVRVQRSVFEGFFPLAELRELERELAGLMDEEEDSLRCYPLCTWCTEDVTSLGQGGRAEEAHYYVF